MIVSKFLIAVALALGSAALAGGGPTEGASAVPLTMASRLGGATLKALAAFTPFVVLRLFPVVETAVVAHGISSSPVRGAQAAASAGELPGPVTRMVATGHPPTSARGPAAIAAGTTAAAGPSAHLDTGRLGGTRPASTERSSTGANDTRPPRSPDGNAGTGSTPRQPTGRAPLLRIPGSRAVPIRARVTVLRKELTQ